MSISLLIKQHLYSCVAVGTVVTTGGAVTVHHYSPVIKHAVSQTLRHAADRVEKPLLHGNLRPQILPPSVPCIPTVIGAGERLSIPGFAPQELPTQFVSPSSTQVSSINGAPYTNFPGYGYVPGIGGYSYLPVSTNSAPVLSELPSQPGKMTSTATEPGQWAFYIMGFGLVGFTFRTRRHAFKRL